MIAMVFASSLALQSASPAPLPKAGEEFELTRVTDTSQTGANGSSGSSHDQDALLERVIAVRPDGLELEYDLPKEATAQDRAREWKFPARVFSPPGGPMQLLNRPDLETRLEAWLKAAKWDRQICGKWIFTWNAFHIDCDPALVIPIIQSFDLRSLELRDGGAIDIPNTRGGRTLIKQSGNTFRGVAEIDPEAVRRERAESDVAVGEMLQKPVKLEAALVERGKESASGTVTVTFETSSGTVKRRTTVTELKIGLPSGVTETQTATEVLERRLVPKP